MKHSRKLFKLGLTGGIGSGKSKLRQYLAEAYPRIYTIDADLLGHAIYQYNPIVVRNVRDIFGSETVSVDERGDIVGVNREKLGAIVFSSDERLRTLRSLVST
jgi:dephospho-CoA kinase